MGPGLERKGFFGGGLVGGILITTLIFVTSALLFTTGSITVLFTPLPVLYYYIQLGRVRGTGVFAVSLAVTFAALMLAGIASTLPAILISGILGIIIAELLKKPYSVEKTFLIPVLAILIPGALFLLFQSTNAGKAPWDLAELHVSQYVRESIKVSEPVLSPEQLKLLKENGPQIIKGFTNTLPATTLIGLMLTVWLNILVARYLLQGTGGIQDHFGNLSYWKAPEPMIWVFIVSGLMIMVPVTWAAWTGVNCLLVCLFIYMLQGLAIISCFFERKNVPRLIRSAFYAMILIFPPFFLLALFIIIPLGLFDLWVDFRKYLRMDDTIA